jgi:hypothetical protein
MEDYAAFRNGSSELRLSSTYAFESDQDARLHFSGHVLIDGKAFKGEAVKALAKGTRVVLYQNSKCKLEITTKDTS